MAVIDDMAQKMKGKGQKLRGKLRRDPISGTVDHIKGTVNESVADAKLNTRRSRGAI